ncbi:MAG: hypothetical protein AAFY65_04455 [Pseudomonadota bacterium]
MTRAVNLATLFLPGTSLLILVAAAFAISVELQNDTYGGPTLGADEITDIEFLSQPSPRAMATAVGAACAVTGCDGKAVAKMVELSLPEMSADELALMIRQNAQAVEGLRTHMLQSNGSTAGEALRLQIAAEAEIGALYRSELRQRAAASQ